MMCVTPSVSIVIPCRNEAAFIADCLDSILANDYPKDRLEVLIVDGMSEDKTREILQRYTEDFQNMRLLDNPKKIIPAAMNIGVMQSQGELVLKMDAHCSYPADYIASCVRYLLEFNADMAGGVWTIATRSHSLVAESIAMALSHWFASGNAYVKIGSKHPRWADAAAFGCWKRETMKKLGLFNEDLAGSSDMDFNMRLRKCGGKILLVPDIRVTYYADPDLMTFWKHNLSDGVWATYVLKFGSRAFSWRHWIPMAFVSTVMGTVVTLPFAPAAYEILGGISGTYAATTILASMQLSVERRTLRYLGILPIIFVIRHFAHGIGALYGIVLAVVPGLMWKGRRGANVH
jgi:cellulose synthase/poly-beta-1,6-N-acetylglucosamine synthase-like glycosyltransferase